MMHKIIWLKTPKCAGTSIKTAILSSSLRDKIVIALPDHLQEFISQNTELWNNCFKFAIVRNPFDKFISAWKYLELTKVHDLKWAIDNLPIEKQHYKGFHHLTRTQCDTIGGYDYDKIIKYENLHEILEIFGMFGENIELPVLNRSERENDYRFYYDDYTRKRVAELYAEDLERFNYEF